MILDTAIRLFSEQGYENAYVDFRMGYACSIAYVLFFIILALTLIQRKALGGKLSGR